MDWEQLNAITGLVSAVCAVLSFVYFNNTKPLSENAQAIPILSTYKLISFLLGWSGWCLACLSFLWFFQPFGSFPSEEDYKKFYAVVIAFPAMVFLNVGISLMSVKPAGDQKI